MLPKLCEKYTIAQNSLPPNNITVCHDFGPLVLPWNHPEELDFLYPLLDRRRGHAAVKVSFCARRGYFQ